MIDLNIDQNYYEVLGVRRSALTRQIQQAYKKKYRQRPGSDTSIKSLRNYFIQLDRALDTLTNINKRSTFDAQWTYNFLKNYAWERHFLTEKDYKYLQRFWSRQHLNREIYASLNFDNFTPDYDLKWYVPFYQEAYWQDVKKKEETYTPSLYYFYHRRYWYALFSLVGFVGVASSVMFMNFIGLGLAILLLAGFIMLSFWAVRSLLIAWSFAREDKTLETADVVDKWVKLKPRLLSPKYKPVYYVAYGNDYGTFYQRVSQNVFNRLKMESPVDVVVSINNPTRTMLSKPFIQFLEKKAKQSK